MIRSVDERYLDYLHDESRLVGNARSISFPKTEEDVIKIAKECFNNKVGITVQGARTGLSASAVPLLGHIMNMSEMNGVLNLENEFLTVQPGFTVDNLYKTIKNNMFFPSEPTEKTATLGGVVSMNAQGARSLLYGRAGKYIEALRVMLQDFNIYEFKRGQYIFQNNELNLPNGQIIKLNPANIGLPPNADAIDLFIGAEGGYGIITAVTLKLAKKPEEMWGICFFFAKDKEAAEFIDKVDLSKKDVIAALEFFDTKSMGLTAQLQENTNSLSELQKIPTGAMVYIELHSHNPEEIEETAEDLMGYAAESGSDIDTSWAVCGEWELERLEALRHGVVEAVNKQIDTIHKSYSDVTKIASEMQIPELKFSELYELYKSGIKEQGLNAVVFGHAGSNNLQVNFLPENQKQKEKAVTLIKTWAEQNVLKNGNLVMEQGFGKIKGAWFKEAIKPEMSEAIISLKKQMDKFGLFNPKNSLY